MLPPPGRSTSELDSYALPIDASRPRLNRGAEPMERRGVWFTGREEFFWDGKSAFAMWDGSVRLIDKSIGEKSLRAAITRCAGDLPGDDWLSQ